MNTRNSRTSRANATKADAPAPDVQDQPAQDAPTETPDAAPQVELDPQVPDADAVQPEDAAAQAEATPDAAPVPVQPDATDPATPDTESDEPVTSGDAPTPDAPAQAEVKPATQVFMEMLAAATSATATLDAKLDAFAQAIIIARTETLRTLAARKDDEIIRTVTLSARPDSASGRGPTLAKVQATIAMLLGGAGFVSEGNCHDSTKLRPIYGHVTLPEVTVPFWNAIWTAMDAPFGPFRTAEASTKQINKAAVKAGTAQFKSGYESDNRLPRVNMMNTVFNLANLVPLVPATDEQLITAMRDVISATTAEFARATSMLIPRGPSYVIAPDDRYAVKQELAPVSA